MDRIPFELIQSYRAGAFRLSPGLNLHSQEEAIEFVNQRGFVFFWPINGVTMPSLWNAVAGNRSVAEAHDDPGHVTWGWKDNLLGQRRWYYAKVLRKKATMISLAVAPYFYALSENYGTPEEDYLTLYEQGRLTQEAKTIYELLLKEGPLDTVTLRRAARLVNRESDSRFNKALSDLQADFKILPVGVADAGSWHYAFIYSITAHHFPDLPDLARPISEAQARLRLLELYLNSVGAAQPREIQLLFGWSARIVEGTIAALVSSGILRTGLEIENQPGEWIVLADLFAG